MSAERETRAGRSPNPGFRLLRQLRRTRSLLALLWPYARSSKGLLLLGAAVSAAVIALHLAQPWPLKWVVDSLSGSSAPPPFFSHLSANWQIEFAVLAAAYMLIAVLAASAEYGQLLILAGLGNRMVFAFRSDLFQRVLRLPLAFHERREAGELLTRIVFDTARLRQGVNGVLTRIFMTVFGFLATFGVLAWLDAPLASLVGIAGIVALATMSRTSRRIFRGARKQRKREGRLASLVGDRLLGIRELQVFRPGGEADGVFDRLNAKSLKQEQKVRRLAAGLLLRVQLLLAVCVTLILWRGAAAVQAGRLTPGDLVLFLHYVLALYRPFQQFARQTARSGKTFASAERLTKIMQRQPTITERPEAVPAKLLRGKIALEEVSVKVPRRRRSTHKWSLAGVSATIEAGERVAVVGLNGAGKSTLLRLIPRLLDPTRGRVLLDGRDLKDYGLESLRQQINVVFQDSVFFGLTVSENIALGRLEASFAEIQEAARRSRAHELIERLPDGYETVIGQRGKLLSVGERQRVALARALLRGGRIWLLDEPTTGLDETVRRDLIDLLLEVTRGCTTLWVTHEAEILPSLDRVLALADGRMSFCGTPAEYQAWRSGLAPGSEVILKAGEVKCKA